MESAERIKNILVKYNLKSYVDSCKGMNLHEFEKILLKKHRSLRMKYCLSKRKMQKH